MLKGTLLFLAGLLLGANLVYFLMTRPTAPPRTAQAQPSHAAAGEATRAPAGAATPDVYPASGSVASTAPAPATAPASSDSRVHRRVRTSIAATAPAVPADALLLPVAGIRPDQLADTYSQTRGGTRIHEALDIMAPRGTPVVAAVDGRVEKLFTSKAGGLTVYQFDPGRTHAYYYAHLDAYAPGLHEGQPLRRGDPVGTVGSTGNASEDAPHLHFAIFLLGPEKRWWEGTPVNPYPLLRPD